MKSYWVLFYAMGAAFLFSLQGCTSITHNDSFETTQDVAKKLMDREAQGTVVELFGAKYDPLESKLIAARQIHNWISKNAIDIKKFPSEVQKAIDNKSAIGLLVPQFIPVKAEKSLSRIYENGGIFLPIWDPEFGIGGWWIIPAGPCDGDFCLNCSGCEGYNCITGRFETCVCTNSCQNCDDDGCPSCPSNCDALGR